MYDRRWLLQRLVVLGLLAIPGVTNADEDVVLGGQFATAVHAGEPSGTVSSFANNHVILYYVRLNNPTNREITLDATFTLDGQASAPVRLVTNWRATWVFRAITPTTRDVAISIRDESGAELRAEHIAIPSSSAAPTAHPHE